MTICHYLNLTSSARLCKVATLSVKICVILVVSQKTFAARQQRLDKPSLEIVCEMVARNEDLTSLIKMNYKVLYERTGQLQKPQKSSQFARNRQAGPPITSYNSVWAQDGIKQRHSFDCYFSPREPGEPKSSSSIQIIDGEVTKWGKMPDLMSGKIDYVEKFEWADNRVALMTFRPFAHKLLSEVLVNEYASIRNENEIVDGRETYVVDVAKPGKPDYFARIWIDGERGIPLRIERYRKDPDLVKTELRGRVESIKPYQLQNGGWIAIQGVDTSYYSSDYELSLHVEVDVNSVTVNREDIPDSLFELDFPEGAKIYNAITGITNRKLEAIIDESIEALDLDVSPAIMSSSKQTKQEAKNSQQVPKKPPVNEPTLSENENTTGALADVNPAALKGYSIVWILLPAFLAAFALIIIVLMFRSPSKNIVRRDVK